MHTIKYFVALLLVLGIHGSSAAADLVSDEAFQEERYSGERARDEQAIYEAVQGYVHGFIAADTEALLRLWDARYADQVTYFAVEMGSPLFGLEALRAYYDALNAGYTVHRGDISKFEVRQEGNMAYALLFIHWAYMDKASGLQNSYHDRVTVVLRKRGNRWLFHHMHESMTIHP